MRRYSEGDRVRVDIPDETDPDHDRLHGVEGTVVGVIEDNAGQMTGDDRDSVLFRVQLDDGAIEDFRWRDLRPP
ncbi:hypothetical protein [Halorientalis persicus]|uniref:hypothetical protein n=1 Tax=Halorientalis persicus TaxID=1367881 RepID=UPI000B83752C